LDVEKFDPERLALKRFEAYYRQSEDDYTEVVLVVTADRFLHVYAKDLAKTPMEGPTHRQFGFRLASAQLKSLSEIEVQVQCQPSSNGSRPAEVFAFNVYFLSETLKNGFLDYLSLIVG